MATTTNFGWTTPDDTDLVKDGAAAIRTALGGVDTSFVDLKGGTTGQILSKASGTDLDFSFINPPSNTYSGVVVFDTANQSIPNNTLTALTFTSETLDSDGYHSTVTNTSRLTIPAGKAGKYCIMMDTSMAPNNTGFRNGAIYKNGNGIYYGGEFLGNNINAATQVSAVVDLAVNDYIEFYVYQNSGVSLNCNKASNQYFGMFLIGA
jgi:hypothetical protein